MKYSMLETISKINSVINNFVWGVPAMICIIGVGLIMSIRTNFVQIRKFIPAMKATVGRIFSKKEKISSGAIAIGGPGAVFWMWISALLGMCTKFAEVTLAVHFREKKQ